MSTAPSLLSTQDFATKIRAKYPGAYDSIGDDELTSRIVQKYPEYKSVVNFGLSPETRQAIQENPPNFQDPSDQGVGASLKRTVKGIASIPGQLTTPAKDPAEMAVVRSGGGLSLLLKRLFVDPMQQSSQKADELRQQAKMSEMEGQTQVASDLNHQANMHAIGSVVPGAGPMAANIIDRYQSGDKSGAATDLATILFGPKLAEKTVGAIGPTVRAGVKITGNAASKVADIVDPDLAGIVSPRLAHIIRTAQKVSKIANKLSPAEQAATDAESSAASIPADTRASTAQPKTVLPNATYLRDDIRSLSQQPPVKQLSQLDRANELLRGIKEHEFLSKVQDELNRPEGQPDVAAEIDARMAELAKKPVDVGGSVKPKYAYRVRDVGETGVMPRGHAQASMDLGEANSYMEGRGSAQAAPQEMVRVDLSKLNPSEYEMIPGPNGKQWVRFKGAVPESFISKVPSARLQKLQQMLAQPKPKAVMTEGSDLIEALRQMARAKGAD